MSEIQKLPQAEQEYRDNLTAEIVAESQDLSIYTYNDAEEHGAGWTTIGDQTLRSGDNPLGSVYGDLHTDHEQLHVAALPATEEGGEASIMFRYGFADDNFRGNGRARANELVLGFTLPESQADKLLAAVNADPDYINQLVKAQVKKSEVLDKITVSWSADHIPNESLSSIPKNERSLKVYYHDLNDIQAYKQQKAEALHYGKTPPRYKSAGKDELKYSEGHSVLPASETASEWDILDPSNQQPEPAGAAVQPVLPVAAEQVVEQGAEVASDRELTPTEAAREMVVEYEAAGETFDSALDGLAREATWLDAQSKTAEQSGDAAQAEEYRKARDAYKAVFVEHFKEAIQDQEDPRAFIKAYAEDAATAVVQSVGNEEAYTAARGQMLMTSELLVNATGNTAYIKEVVSDAYNKAKAAKLAGKLATGAA